MSVVGFRTDDTDLQGTMEDEEGYENITVFSGLQQWLLPDVRKLQNRLRTSSTSEGDLMSALVVAIQQIDTATTGKTGNPLKFKRRIVVVTDGRGAMDIGDLEHIQNKIKDSSAPIQLTLLGVDFDDSENGYKEEDKDDHKRKNEETLKEFVEDCDGVFGSLAEAVEQLQIPRIKEVKPTPSYRGTLSLGDARTYDATISIDVERYPCTMIAKPPSASSFVTRTDLAGTQSSATVTGEDDPMNGELSAVRNQRVYQVENPDEPGQKMNVEADELERGYEYGRTAVHISESDANVVNIETSPGLELLGFLDATKFDRYLPMSRSNYIVPQKSNVQAKLALSSFIHALWEADCYAVARLVTKENKPPLIVLLVPRIEPEIEVLVEVELPFEEDMRRYKFPPLDKKLTVSGKTITEHKDLPSDELMQSMSDYVDAMDLSTFDRDDDGEPAEYAKMEDAYSPLLHRVNQMIRWRATHADPSLPLPDPSPILTKYANPPAELIQRTKDQLAALKKAADVKKVPPKAKGRGKRSRAEREKPLSGLDVDELLGNQKRIKIDSTNLIPSFKQTLAATDELEAIQEAADAMGTEIRNLIRNSVADSAYNRALEAMRVMRDEITELEEPEIWNVFVTDLKKELLGKELGGDRREMWWKIRGNKYGLVDRKRCFASAVSEEQAAEFYRGA
ncbi:ATP-dependent DNA helicase II subunit 2 [Periconia macrospinosa]|uniref:ATP-dependent DNA helicase II subunit 2 n=1 Tax=Periconia macrospinosa TaxID=97972 RepID=A0A2V1DYC1_9PLEO|nr:ATP-dependent DNA helicase II subunit 2 [Periconia macrospinosa]